VRFKFWRILSKHLKAKHFNKFLIKGNNNNIEIFDLSSKFFGATSACARFSPTKHQNNAQNENISFFSSPV